VTPAARASIAIGLRPAPAAPLLGGPNLAATVAAAGSAGFGAVELLLGRPEDAPDLDAALRGAGVGLRGLLSGPVRTVEGLSLAEPATAEAAVARVGALIDLAAGHRAHVVLGWILGGDPADEPTLIASLERCRDAARAAAVPLLIEPVNRYENPGLTTAAAAAALIDRAGGGIGLLLDTFHMSIEEADPAATLRAYAPRIGHLHLADSNRRLPGEGHLPLGAWLDALRAAGYTGTIGIEALHGEDLDAAAMRAAAALDDLHATTEERR
jgi:sugar phosphate isomerase/epimerase